VTEQMIKTTITLNSMIIIRIIFYLGGRAQ